MSLRERLNKKNMQLAANCTYLGVDVIKEVHEWLLTDLIPKFEEKLNGIITKTVARNVFFRDEPVPALQQVIKELFGEPGEEK